MQDTTEISKNQDRSPDSYMINASYTRMDDKGKLDLTVFSPIIWHFKYQNSSFIQKPDIIIYKNNQAWRVTSQKAKSVNGTEVFYLQNDVKIKQIEASSAATTLMTQSLTVFPKTNLATTDKDVLIEQPGVKINAKGLRADLNSGNIQLLSKARGQYDPIHH